MILLADIGQTTWLILWLVMLTDLFTGLTQHPENQERAAATVDGTRDFNITTAGDARSHFYKRDSSAASFPSVDHPHPLCCVVTLSQQLKGGKMEDDEELESLVSAESESAEIKTSTQVQIYIYIWSNLEFGFWGWKLSSDPDASQESLIERLGTKRSFYESRLWRRKTSQWLTEETVRLIFHLVHQKRRDPERTLANDKLHQIQTPALQHGCPGTTPTI